MHARRGWMAEARRRGAGAGDINAQHEVAGYWHGFGVGVGDDEARRCARGERQRNVTQRGTEAKVVGVFGLGWWISEKGKRQKEKAFRIGKEFKFKHEKAK